MSYFPYFQCEGELAKLKHDDVVRNIGLGYTDGLSSVDGMRQMSLSDEQVEDKNVAPANNKESTKVSNEIFGIWNKDQKNETKYVSLY